MEKPKDSRKGIKGRDELLDGPEQLKTMTSEVFLAVFVRALMRVMMC